MRPRAIPLLALSLAPLPACSSSGGDATGAVASGDAAGDVPCDPFALAPVPLSLGALLAAGRAQDGTIYAADETPSHEHHVFVSSGGALVRQRVAGEGESPDFYVFDLAAGAPTAMGVLTGPLPAGSKTFDVDTQGEKLALLAASDVATMPVQNLPGAQVLAYDAHLADGRELVVVRPQDDWTYADFRVFFGARPVLAERHLVNGGATRGSSTMIEFTADGADALATFTWVYDPDGGSGPGDATLSIGGTSYPLTLGPTDAEPAGVSFTCFAP